MAGSAVTMDDLNVLTSTGLEKRIVKGVPGGQCPLQPHWCATTFMGP